MAKYTLPRLYKGKKVTHVPKGSTKLKEEAKEIWYVNYTYEGKQYRIKGDINRIKDYKQKEVEANVLLESIKQDLADGFNPKKPQEWVAQILKDTITLDEAILKFKAYHTLHRSRKKTIQTYLSKLLALSSFYPNILLSEIDTKKLQKFIQSKISDETYSQNSVKSAKRIFCAFFNVCIVLDLIKTNPIGAFDKRIKSNKITKEKHVPFSDEDLQRILAYLDDNDPYVAFFSRMIYYTCIRPAEIRGLRVGDINVEKRSIKIPMDIKKVTKGNNNDVIEINESFIPFLRNLELQYYPSHYYLTGSLSTIVGEKKIGENTPYNRFVLALKKLNLDKKGYDLYSFKHTSNIKKYKSGWTLAEIMKANRHTSITTTEIYLRKLGEFVDVQTKQIPLI